MRRPTDDLRRAAARGVRRSPTRLAIWAVVCVAAPGVIASALAPAPRSRRGSRDGAPRDPRTAARVSPRGSSHPVVGEPTAARDVARSFLKGYLALACGRGRGSVVDATPLMRHELARQAAPVTPTE